MMAIGCYLDRWRRYYVAVWELSCLNDSELAALGIQRQEIVRVALDTTHF